MHIQRVAFVASLETFLIFLKIKRWQKAWLENPIAFKTRTSWQQAFISSCLLFFRAHSSNKNTRVIEWIEEAAHASLPRSKYFRAHIFFPSVDTRAFGCSIVWTIITLKSGTWESRSPISIVSLPRRVRVHHWKAIGGILLSSEKSRLSAKLRADSIRSFPRRADSYVEYSLTDRWLLQAHDRSPLVWRNETGEVKA